MKLSFLRFSRAKGILLMLLAAALLIVSCAKEPVPEGKYPLVTMELENGGIVEIVLDPNSAPNTVANFVSLIQQGFYNGLTFHRAVEGFIVQGGSPDGTTSGKIDYTIAGEFIDNRFTDNRLKHLRGTISMARSEDYNSAGSQFFICMDEQRSLDGIYAAFGQVVSGMEHIDEIAKLETDSSQHIIDQPVIKSMSVETFGINYSVKKHR
ncbi:MAG: peptidylprolyl isomerase [Christensenellales bacterium]